MKMLKKVNAMVLGLALLLAGCGKDEHQDDPSPVNRTQGMCLLTSEGSPAKVSYTYNSQGKLERVNWPGVYRKDVSYDAAGNMAGVKTYDGNNVLSESVTITYNGNNLPVNRIRHSFPANQPDYTTQSKSYYNAANQLIRQDFYGADIIGTDTVIIGKFIYSYPAADQAVCKKYDQDGGGGYRLSTTETWHFDNMKSPFVFLGNLMGENLYVSTHNIIKIARTDHYSNTTTTDVRTFDYNAEGYATRDSKTGVTWNFTCQ